MCISTKYSQHSLIIVKPDPRVHTENGSHSIHTTPNVEKEKSISEAVRCLFLNCLTNRSSTLHLHDQLVRYFSCIQQIHFFNRPSKEPFIQPLFSKLDTSTLFSRSLIHLSRVLPATAISPCNDRN